MDIQVFLMDLPPQIKGYTVPNEDGSFSVFINSRCGKNIQEATYKHEIAHIKNGDFDKQNVGTIELAAHGINQNTIQKLSDDEIKKKYPTAYRYFSSRKKRYERERRKLYKQIEFERTMAETERFDSRRHST